MDMPEIWTRKIAFVTPWYGPDLAGGAETLARSTAHWLQQAGFSVEVLTTCIRDFHADWATNHYRPGSDEVEGIAVRRFAVGKRDKDAFDRVNGRLMHGNMVTEAEEQVFIAEMFHCPSLYEYISAHRSEYLFFFLPYMFSSTYFGSQICPRRSTIIPCLHNESYAYMGLYREVLPQVRALVFNSPAEKALAQRLYGEGQDQIREVIGMGIDPQAQGNARRFRQKYDIHSPFLLYVGRREPGKNTPLLLAYWARYVQHAQRDIQLVLIGRGQVQIPATAAGCVRDLGFVSTQDKLDAYAAATVFCQPSVNESFSIVLLEAWRAGTPALVHGDCDVTRGHCRLSNGGLYFSNDAEFSATVEYLLDNPVTAAKMGQNGRNYVLRNYGWTQIVDKYRHLIHRMEAEIAR